MNSPLSVSVDSADRMAMPPPNIVLSSSADGVRPQPRASHPAMLRVREFGSLSPTPNLRRLMDSSGKAVSKQKLQEREEQEQRVRVIETNPALAPPRSRNPRKDEELAFTLSDDKTIVSLPIKLIDLRYGGWYALENRFQKEYDEIRERSLGLLFGPREKPTRIGRGLMEETVFTVAPFKDCRVKLSKQMKSQRKEDSTFYNASWVGRDFIAAAMPQGEKPREQLWRLVWEYDVPTIVMLNDDSEGKRRHPQITRYWPNEMNEWEAFGEMEVRKTEQVSARNMACTVRKLSIRKQGDEENVKTVTHMQYLHWPDGGIPSDRDDYLEFIQYLLGLTRSIKETEPVPVLVHCFGGKGRTGTTIAILLELQKLERYGGSEVDICGTVSEMRSFRSLLVETAEQYKFIYAMVLTMLAKNRVKYHPDASPVDLGGDETMVAATPRSSEF